MGNKNYIKKDINAIYFFSLYLFSIYYIYNLKN